MKRLLLIAMIMAMVVCLFAGCKAKIEEGASLGEFVEDDFVYDDNAGEDDSSADQPADDDQPSDDEEPADQDQDKQDSDKNKEDQEDKNDKNDKNEQDKKDPAEDEDPADDSTEEEVDPDAEDSGWYKVISYNIKSMYYDRETGGTKDQREGVVAFLKAQDADIIGLQEVDNNRDRSFNYDQMKYLSEQLGYYYYYIVTKAPDGEYGHGFLSKYPIKEVKGDFYKVQDDKSSEDRGYTRAVIEFPDGDVVFYNTHLCTGYKEVPTGKSAQQLREILSMVYQEKLPTILTGDYNMSVSTRSSIVDRSKAIPLNGGSDGTFINSKLNIDDIYVRNVEYYTDSLTGESIFMSVEPYSDHNPCWGYFKF